MTDEHRPGTAADSPKDDRITRHPAFIEVIQAELKHYRGTFLFLAEIPLTREPLRIDILIIKKLIGAVIEKNIARIFRGYNIVEYKSPGDYISVKVFYKALCAGFTVTPARTWRSRTPLT